MLNTELNKSEQQWTFTSLTENVYDLFNKYNVSFSVGL